jgi:hypothetical protein
MSQQVDLSNLNCSLTKAGLTGISGAVTTYSTAAAGVLQSFGGKLVQKAQDSGVQLGTVDAVTGKAFNALAANQGCVLVLGYNAAGAVQVAQSNIVALDAAGNFIGWAPQAPTLPDSVAPFAYIVVKDGATGGAFTPGSTAWNATGMSYSVQDIMYLPGRPQIA